MNKFPDEVILKDAGMRGHSRLFELQNDFRYISSYGTITVPKGFITDGASIPEVFWNIFQPFGPWFKAAIPHDWGYSKLNTQYTRSEVDLIFKEAMYNLGIGWVKRETIYRAVQLFGWTVYKGYKG